MIVDSVIDGEMSHHLFSVLLPLSTFSRILEMLVVVFSDYSDLTLFNSMRTPIHRYTEKWTKHPLVYYLRFRDLLLIDKEHKKLSEILSRPTSNLVNPDTKTSCVHPVR